MVFSTCPTIEAPCGAATTSRLGAAHTDSSFPSAAASFGGSLSCGKRWRLSTQAPRPDGMDAASTGWTGGREAQGGIRAIVMGRFLAVVAYSATKVVCEAGTVRQQRSSAAAGFIAGGRWRGEISIRVFPSIADLGRFLCGAFWQNRESYPSVRSIIIIINIDRNTDSCLPIRASSISFFNFQALVHWSLARSADRQIHGRLGPPLGLSWPPVTVSLRRFIQGLPVPSLHIIYLIITEPPFEVHVVSLIVF